MTTASCTSSEVLKVSDCSLLFLCSVFSRNNTTYTCRYCTGNNIRVYYLWFSFMSLHHVHVHLHVYAYVSPFFTCSPALSLPSLISPSVHARPSCTSRWVVGATEQSLDNGRRRQPPLVHRPSVAPPPPGPTRRRRRRNREHKHGCSSLLPRPSTVPRGAEAVDEGRSQEDVPLGL